MLISYIQIIKKGDRQMATFTTIGPDGSTKTRNSKTRQYVCATWINWQGEGWECKSFHETHEAAKKYAQGWINAGRSEVKIIEAVA